MNSPVTPVITIDDPRRRAVLETIKSIGIHRSSDGAKIYADDGHLLTWLVDMRAVFLHPPTLDAIADMFWDIYASRLPFQLGGMELTGIPLLVGILQKGLARGHVVNGFIVRRERKKTGLGRIIEGKLTDEPIVMLDDLMNSGGSLEKTRAVLEHENRKIREGFVILTYETKRGKEWQSKHGIPVTCLYALSELGLERKEKEATPPTRFFREQWNFPAPGGIPSYIIPKSAPLYDQGHVYFGANSGTFYALKAENGALAWQFDIKTGNPKGILSSPAAHAGKVYFGAYNGGLYCLDGKTGQPVWSNLCCEWVGSSPLLVPEHDMLVLGLEYARPGNKGSTAGFSMKTGEKLWQVWFREYQHGSAAFSAEDMLAIYGTNDGMVCASKIMTGEPVWSVATGGAVKYAPAIDTKRGLAIAGSHDGGIYIIDTATGALRATIKTDNIIYTTPLITGKHAWCGSADRNMYVIDLDTFQIAKKINCNSQVFASPRLVNDGVIFAATNGTLYEFHKDTLERLATLALPECVTNGVAVREDQKRIFVHTLMNEIVAIDRS